ncbi:MAG TPA: hypothetical protein VLT33_12790, partial [Labilithrix sp.]|nr:hypothetical protein [Labilithrix sp.]
MQDIGHRAEDAATGPSPAPSGPRRAAFLALGAACALVPAIAMWGFTVDDALIPARYAHHLAAGVGYRFDTNGPSTDGVTPLPWSLLLAPLATGSSLATLLRAKVLGVVAWTIAGAALGARVGVIAAPAVRAWLAAASLVVMALAFAIGAWAASGMETGLATALATIAVTRSARPVQVAVLAGLAATLRPELVVWAVAIAAGTSLAAPSERRLRDAVVGAAIAFVPFAICAGLRLVFFGRPAPLAVLAKPSDLLHGWVYLGAATLVVLTPLLVCAPLALWRARGLALAIVVAFLAHGLAVAGAGGDWMPYARLVVPVAPSLVVAFVELTKSTKPVWSAARLAAAGVLGVLLAWRAAPAGRSVYADRADLIARARPALDGARVVAALDIGWASAATEARIVDLAGLTDPSIALLPGGHTSKRVDVSMLLDRGVDTVIVY